MCLELMKPFNSISKLFRSLLKNFKERHALLNGLASYFSSILHVRGNSHVGVVILTTLALPDNFSHSNQVGHSIPPHFMGLRNLQLMERILVERTALAILHWNFFYAHAKTRFRTFCSLFLVYKETFSSVYSLDGWLDIVPNHEVNMSKNEAQGSKPKISTDELVEIARTHLTAKPRKWIKPDQYCELNAKTVVPMSISNGKYRLANDPRGELSDQLVEDFQYVTLKGGQSMRLFEISLRAALARDSEYIVVLNPHAIGITQEHIHTALSILQNYQPQVVVGLTIPCSSLEKQAEKTTLVKEQWDRLGIYLVAIRNTPELVLGARQFTDGVDWSSPTAASRLRANLTSFSPPWNALFLRDRLSEVMGFEDLPHLERLLNVPLSELVEDSITVVIAIGRGHPDDCLDPIEDAQLIADDPRNQAALKQTLDLIQCNSSGHRSIQVVIISSRPTVNTSYRIYQPDASKPAIQLEFHPYTTSSSAPSFPNRGELINFAVEHFARGSALVFVEPGVNLPFDWDTAVFQCLEHPGVGMSSFAYRFALKDKYMQRKHIGWAIRCYFANWLVNRLAAQLQLPTSGQPLFIYAHYLRCAGGYPKSAHRLHPIDLCLAVSRCVGRVTVAKSSTASAGIPMDFYLRHGAIRGGFYLTLVTVARLLGTSQDELNQVISMQESGAARRLPLIQPDYLDGY